LAKSGLDLRIVDGERLIRKIRLQKTASELELVRYATTANAAAVREAVKTVRDGATLQELRGEFIRACGDKMNSPVYMAIDFVIPELIHGEIKGFAINPHSVGLNHTDEPSKNEFGFWDKDDIELVENMVLSVDMPVLDNGLGGSAHLEDLVLIGKDGPELLNSSDDRLIIV